MLENHAAMEAVVGRASRVLLPWLLVVVIVHDMHWLERLASLVGRRLTIGKYGINRVLVCGGVCRSLRIQSLVHNFISHHVWNVA